MLEVPEAISQGRTIGEAKANLSEALEAAIEWRAEEDERFLGVDEVTIAPINVRLRTEVG